MFGRREFIKRGIRALAGAGIFMGSLFSAAKWLYAEGKRTILPGNTRMRSLISRNPRTLDSRNLDVTDLKSFGTMGLSDHTVDLAAWRLEVSGRVKHPLALTYSEILSLPAYEKKFLMICPGVFVNHGLWKGISMKELLEKAGWDRDAGQVLFSGPKGHYEKVEYFPLDDVLVNRVFLAYGVNGEALPKRNGFPLRVVAEGYYGSDWVKYVDRMVLKKG